MKISLRTKLYLMILPLMVISLVLLFFVINPYRTAQAQLRDIQSDVGKAIGSGKFGLWLNCQMKEYFELILTDGSDAEFQESRQRAHDALDQWKKEVNSAEDTELTAKELKPIHEIDSEYRELNLVCEAALGLARKGKKAEAIRLVELGVRPLFTSLTEKLERVDLRGEVDLVKALAHMNGNFDTFVGLSRGELQFKIDKLDGHISDTVLVFRFARSFNRQLGDYYYLLLTEQEGYGAQVENSVRSTERALLMWKENEERETSIDSSYDDVEAVIRVQEQHLRLSQLGRRIPNLVTLGKKAEATNMIILEMEPISDDYIALKINETVAIEGRELKDSFDEMATSSNRIKRVAIPLSLLVLIIGFGTPWILTRKLIRPIQALGAAALRVGSGNLDTRVSVNSTDELAGLSRAFNKMTESLRVSDESLRHAKDVALKSSRVKSEFLANMSHEIRTPMNGIIGMTELALDTTLNAEQRDYLDMVRQSADSLLLIINDILDFSKVESGKIELDDIDFDLPELIGDTLRPLAVRADQKGLELTYHVVPGVAEHLKGDPQRLRQILVNLVGNAIKFTEKGEVSILVEKEWQTGSEVGLHIQVRDTGIGVPPEKQSVIFGAFAQADGSTTRKYGGTGLGLAISSQLVESMGGRIWVESPAASSAREENSPGTVMHFTLLLALATDATKRSPLELAELRDLKVLVVDDNATNRWILQETLEHWRMKPTLVEGGSAALTEMKRAVEVHEPFRLVLLDAQMPEMDGFSVVERIKERPEFAGAAVMMLSSGDQNSQVARCRQLGLELYLVKPVRQSELLAAIKAVLGAKLPERKVVEINVDHVSRAGERALHILLVEDNLINQRLALRLLQKRGNLVEIAANGREAINAFAKRPFDVVLMDVQMPEMNGFEATAVIREREQASGAHTPIIAMTAYAMEGDRERCLAAGMDAYLSKPIKAAQLMSTMESLISKSVSDALAFTTVARDQVDVDFSALLTRADGDPELAEELVEIFIKEWPRLLAAIGEAIKQNDSPAVERAAHAAKGSICYFTNGSAVQAALRLQQMGAEANLSEAQATLADLETAVELVTIKLREFSGACVS